MKSPSRSKRQIFIVWWKANKWKGTQWWPVFVAEDAFNAGYKAGLRLRGRAKTRAEKENLVHKK